MSSAAATTPRQVQQGEKVEYRSGRYFVGPEEVLVPTGATVETERMIYDDDGPQKMNCRVYLSSPDNPAVESRLRGHGYVAMGGLGGGGHFLYSWPYGSTFIFIELPEPRT